LKNGKKLQQETLKQLTSKESLIDKETIIGPIEIEKSLDVKIQTMEKGTNTNPIDITNPKDANPVEVGISSDVEVQTMEIPSISTNKF
jgi:hypothetical protein